MLLKIGTNMNKKLIAVAVLSLTSMTAFAQMSMAPAATASTTAGATGGELMYAPVSNSVVRYSASSAFGPALTSSNDTCMGSSSMGASGASFSLSLGSTWTDKNCVMLKNARELWNQGQHAASMALMCSDDDIRYSISVSGGVMDRRKDGAIIRLGCPMTKDEWIAKGRPLLDPTTGAAVEVGSVVQAAPVPKVAMIAPAAPTVSVDSHGVLMTASIEVPKQKSADDIIAHAAVVRANTEMAGQPIVNK